MKYNAGETLRDSDIRKNSKHPDKNAATYRVRFPRDIDLVEATIDDNGGLVCVWVDA